MAQQDYLISKAERDTAATEWFTLGGLGALGGMLGRQAMGTVVSQGANWTGKRVVALARRIR